MCSPSCMDRLFINLKVLSQIQPGQKIYTDGDYLVLDEGISYRQKLSRWWLSETREKSLKKIQEIIRSAVYCGQNAINSQMMENSDESWGVQQKVEVKQWEVSRDKYLQMDNLGLLNCLVREMEQSLTGLKNLKDTYKDDATLCAKMDLEIEMVERHIEKFNEFPQTKNSTNFQKKK